MPAVKTLRCIYDTRTPGWSAELTLLGGGEVAAFALPGAEHVEPLVEAFADATRCDYDPETGRISFEYRIDFDDEDDDADAEIAEDDEDAREAPRKGRA